MVVSDIVSRNKSKVTVYLDGEIAFVLYKGDLHRYGLETGSEIREDAYDEILREVLPKRALDRSCKLLLSRDYTERQIREKLLGDGYPEEVIIKTVERLKKERFLDDTRYAENFIYSCSKKKSRNRLFADLALKGVSREEAEEIYERLLDCGDIDGESETVLNYLKKKHVNPSSLEYEEREKLFASVMRKGFSYDSVKAAMAMLEEE
ncbi:MAG: regulatory protein RecX [Lachnospiraceae bacterium]|nr:regulatory protein RecX [Lachnospiraceae bacterium]